MLVKTAQPGLQKISAELRWCRADLRMPSEYLVVARAGYWATVQSVIKMDGKPISAETIWAKIAPCVPRAAEGGSSEKGSSQQAAAAVRRQQQHRKRRRRRQSRRLHWWWPWAVEK